MSVNQPSGQKPEKRRGLARLWSDVHPWPVKVLTGMLAVQGAGLLAVGLLYIDRTNGWHSILVNSAFYATLVPLGLLALLAAVGFFRLSRGAWVMAMLVQGLNLLIALFYYFTRDPDSLFLFAMMLYAIIMVVYLNYAEVPAAFRAQPGTGPLDDDPE